MSDLIQRDYYKIFTGTNQLEGHDKIHLGYNADTTEITLKKDNTTFFHMPFFADSQSINDSSLVADGAIPGPIPALADRIYKKLGNYGNSTPWGTASERSDGTWLCSWLYAKGSESPVWLDRYYAPGRIAYKEALEGNAAFSDYLPSDPIYFDVISTLTLEPGVLYQYFHQGEDTAIKFIETFAGEGKKNLRLDIEDWSCLCPDKKEPVDRSNYNNQIVLKDFKDKWIVNLFDPGYRDRNAFSFDNNDFIDCYVVYSDSYNLYNEFSLSFWVRHSNWSQANSTQLLGNMRLGGFGVFYNNTNYNPFFAVPESTYGHLFYFNQEGNPYLDKNIQSTLGQPLIPVSTHVNSNAEIVSVERDVTENRISKYNHVGDRLTVSKTQTGGRHVLQGTPKVSILGLNDTLTVITTLSTYTYDKDLLLLSAVPVGHQYKEQLAYDTSGNLHRELSSIDVKFDLINQKWHINEFGNLYRDNIFVDTIPSNNKAGLGSNTNVALDPENNLWVLAGSNTVYKLDIVSLKILDTYEIGVQTSEPVFKNIGFIRSYSRPTNTFTWYAIIYQDYEKTLYQVTLKGELFKRTYLPPLLNVLDPVTTLQDVDLLTYITTGDFTGYNNRRIFNKIQYNNNPQIQFKASVTPSNQNLPNSIYTASVPVQYLTNDEWHLVTVTYKNQGVKLYINNVLRDTFEFPGSIDFSYEFKNNLYIGTPVGKSDNYNTEMFSQGVIWNGYIDSVRIYDYAIDPKLIQYFIREKTYTSDIEWNIPTASLPYVEVIDRFFKHRLPGHKSGFFNIRISGAQITDPIIRAQAENEIKQIIEQVKPAYAELLNVEWID